MIPPDVASALRLQLPDQAKLAAAQPQNQPVVAPQRITDALRDLQPGQRIMAEIQAMLPNGTYRAVVAQRDVTLALPFSAKPGDTLELEVTESDGKLTLAFVTNRSDAAAGKAAADSASTSLSPAGKLIGNLMAGIEADGKRAPAAPLNGSAPLVEAMPKTAADLAPVLKQAVTQSGLFYEAHQARWVAGDLPTEALRQEPQGKYPVVHMAGAGAEQVAAKMGNAPETAGQLGQLGLAQAAQQDMTTNSPVPRDLAGLVQQQLDGLASQNFAWQGQIWPGQQMRWEIGKDLDDSRSGEGEDAQRWQTRLKLSLPLLGDIDVALNLRPGGQVGIALTAQSEASEARLREESKVLRTQFEAAGLNLTELQVAHGQAAE